MRGDTNLLAVVATLAKDYAKEVNGENNEGQQIGREDLELICFEYVTA